MIRITNLENGLDLFKALGSDVRVRILEILQNDDHQNMNSLAEELGITNGALTAHIRKLEECGLIRITSKSTGHGNQKIASLAENRILIEFTEKTPEEHIFKTSIPVGHYSACDVYPTCGLATSEHLIGNVDDQRYFFHRDRFQAQILWFTRGYIEYIIPNFIPYGQKIDELSFSMELSSEAPGFNENWPSDITFSLNGVDIATWTSPGDFGQVRGLLNPDWWFDDWNQYGLLKMLQINQKGTFIDGVKQSDVSISSFHLTDRSKITLRLSVREDAQHVGGLTLYGKSFGNYDQDINVRISYNPLAEKEGEESAADTAQEGTS